MQAGAPAVDPMVALGQSVGDYLTWVTVILGMVVFLYSVWYYECKNRAATNVRDMLLMHLIKATSAAGIPSGWVLLWCAAQPRLYPHIAGLGWALALAAAAFIYSAVRGMIMKT